MPLHKKIRHLEKISLANFFGVSWVVVLQICFWLFFSKMTPSSKNPPFWIFEKSFFFYKSKIIKDFSNAFKFFEIG
jgi:hypothetical protein